MAETCTVVIAAADVLPMLKERTAAVNGEVLTFSDAEALRALEAIIKRRPRIVTLERMFASSPRGVALINRIKADPGLIEMEIQVVAHDTDYARVLREGAPAAQASAAAPPMPAPAKGAAAVSAGTASPILAPLAAPLPAVAPAPAAPPLDHRGTRRAARFRMRHALEITVDGNAATLVDLSTVGAQVIASAALKPNQRVRLALNDNDGNIRLTGSVAWASFEITKSGPRYRAGIQFVKPDEPAIEAFCSRHRQD